MEFRISMLYSILSVLLYGGFAGNAKARERRDRDVTCPSSSSQVREEIKSCTQNYNQHLGQLTAGPRFLYSGVDVEAIRTFCQGYDQGTRCLEFMIKMCPETKSQVQTYLYNMTNFQELCTHPKLYEVYAMHQNCYIAQKKYSENCYRTYYTVSDDVTYNAKIGQQAAVQIVCIRLDDFLNCVKDNIFAKCGPEASTITDVLVNTALDLSQTCSSKALAGTTKSSASGATSSPGEGTNRQESARSTAHVQDAPTLTLLFVNVCLQLGLAFFLTWRTS
ncbi:uncharacterized protein LOC106172692 [Lingula anatina]|uniref:Uncharacterized protein LOC106172692 n=1 Tax=Lingula anatina TaxID=7574 RepID=A0A1S3JF41_LINAN|nr:uncharacterized protein LOC106172692 [Lingula anatina]|eukprot:XP_013408958.1 uncharacterized protein LOC106172692 [Lingula anatina]